MLCFFVIPLFLSLLTNNVIHFLLALEIAPSISSIHYVHVDNTGIRQYDGTNFVLLDCILSSVNGTSMYHSSGSRVNVGPSSGMTGLLYFFAIPLFLSLLTNNVIHFLLALEIAPSISSIHYVHVDNTGIRQYDGTAFLYLDARFDFGFLRCPRPLFPARFYLLHPCSRSRV